LASTNDFQPDLGGVVSSRLLLPELTIPVEHESSSLTKVLGASTGRLLVAWHFDR
jgi:hypothetical protein